MIGIRDRHNIEFMNLERMIKAEMDALRKNMEDWRQADKDKYELIIKLIEKEYKIK